MPNIKELHVNGAVRRVEADAERSLLSVLRDDLDLSGCKYGCGEGKYILQRHYVNKYRLGISAPAT
jgi:xanthine dehydrogenase iron-sulfur cluster and FAD-binding subunit A